MNIKGRLTKCDRCGTLLFCETNGEGEADGGYTRWNTFEESPEGWEQQRIAGKYKSLCPECNAEYLRLLGEMEERFMSSAPKSNNDIQIVTRKKAD